MKDIQPIEARSDASIEQRFWEFHKRNPHVFEYLKTLALKAKKRGYSTYSINGLFEVLRWKYAIHTDGDTYNLNNDYRSRYARLLMRDVPELEGFFQVRELQTESVLA